MGYENISKSMKEEGKTVNFYLKGGEEEKG
jgi:hypothetical protein